MTRLYETKVGFTLRMFTDTEQAVLRALYESTTAVNARRVYFDVCKILINYLLDATQGTDEKMAKTMGERRYGNVNEEVIAKFRKDYPTFDLPTHPRIQRYLFSFATKGFVGYRNLGKPGAKRRDYVFFLMPGIRTAINSELSSVNSPW